MRHHAMSRGRLFVVCVLGALAGVVPTASADTLLPAWTCRASAAYAEVNPLLNAQRVEPVLANGIPNRTTPDRESARPTPQPASRTSTSRPGLGDPLITAQRRLRDHDDRAGDRGGARPDVASDGGVLEPRTISLPGLVVTPWR